MAEHSTRPCVFPGCRDQAGDPELTQDVICQRSRTHYRKVLAWLGEDYAMLRAEMPSPVVRGETVRRSSSRSYGHPAEWASDQRYAIATTLNQIHAGIADDRGDPAAPEPSVAEQIRVDKALHYLDTHFEALCTYAKAGEAATALSELHRGVRNAMGHGTQIQRLPAPCPECDLLLLVRVLDDMDDHVECRNPGCGVRIGPTQYGLWTRILADEVLDRNVTESA